MEQRAKYKERCNIKFSIFFIIIILFLLLVPVTQAGLIDDILELFGLGKVSSSSITLSPYYFAGTYSWYATDNESMIIQDVKFIKHYDIIEHNSSKNKSEWWTEEVYDYTEAKMVMKIEADRTYNECDDKGEKCKEVIYHVPNAMPVKDTAGSLLSNVNKQVSLDSKDYFSLVLNPDVHEYRIGSGTIYILEDVSAIGVFQDVVPENNFTHLNISDTAPYDDLLLYTPFDDNVSSTISYDYTELGNDGTIIQALNVLDGVYGNAMEFDGINDVISRSPATWMKPLQSNKTLSFWIRFNDNSTGTKMSPWEFCGNTACSAAGGYWRTNFDTDRIGGNIYDTSVAPNVAVEDISGFGSEDTWYHVVMYYNHGWNDTAVNLTVWLNGNLQGSDVETTNTSKITTNIFYIGLSSSAGSSKYFNGFIDDFMVFNNSLTDAQVSDIYNNQSARFKPEGNHTMKPVNIIDGFNRVNITADFEALMSSNISARIGMINDSLDNTTDLVLYMPFEWGKAWDISGEGNDGTITGAVFNLTGGLNETGGFEFDGVNDYIEMPSSSDYDFSGTQDFSISLWFNLKDIPPGTQEALIMFGDGGDNVGTWDKGIKIKSDDFIYGHIFDGSNKEPKSSSTVSINSWNHAVLVFNGSDSFIYLNGVSGSKTATSSSFDHTNPQPVLGFKDSGGGIFRGNGTIDEVRIYNRSLTATEISDIFKNDTTKFSNVHYTPYQNLTTSGSPNIFNISNQSDYIFPDFIYLAGNSSSKFYSPILKNNITLNTWVGLDVAPPVDNEYPQFSNYWDNNGTLIGSGLAKFNVTLLSTNGTVQLEIDGSNHTADKYDWLEFDGINDYVGLVFGDEITDSNLISYTVWVKVNSMASPDYLLWRNDDSLGIRADDENTFAYFVNGSGGNSALGQNLDITSWNFISASYNGTTIVAYENGVAVHAAVNSVFVPSSNDFRIASDGNPDRYLNASIDEVRVYNKTLTGAEVLEIYNSGRIENNSLPSDNLVLWLPINESYGSSTYDASGEGNDGTITGAVWNNTYTASATLSSAGVFPYYWNAWNNGTGGNYNVSAIRYYTVNVSDDEYPVFSSYTDNNATYSGEYARFNVTIISTNGTAGIQVNDTNYSIYNLTANVYNLTINLSVVDVYPYYYWAYGNGTNTNYNVSLIRYFSVNESVPIVDNEFPQFSSYLDNNATYSGEYARFNVTIVSTNGTAGLELNGTNYTAYNLSTMFNVTTNLTTLGDYPYYWWAYGNGTDENYNHSAFFRYFTVNATPVSFSNIDLLFLNTTSSVFKTVFEEGEDFFTFINWTNENNLSIDNTMGECNVTLLEGVEEIPAGDDNFTLCTSGCDYSTYNETFTFETTTDATMDFIHAYVCHEQLAQEDTIVNISCAGGSYQEVRSPAEIPLCSEDVSFQIVNTSVCIGETQINVTATYDGIFNRRKRILNVEADRRYSSHTQTFADGEVGYNDTLNLWRTNHTHEYYEHGEQTIFANCTHNTVSNYDNSTLETITIVNLFPKIMFEQLETGFGLFNLTTNMYINYTSGIWNWSVAVVDDDLDNINYTFYNGSGYAIQSNETKLIPIALITTDALFSELENPYNLTVWANDTFGNLTQSSMNFTITLIPDNEYSQFSSYTEYPSDPATYVLNQDYLFNVTIISTNGTTGIEFDGANYSVSNLSTIFNSSINDLPSGSYNYYWWSYANGTDGNYNVTSTQTYTINQVTSEIFTPINHTRANFLMGNTSATACENIYLNATLNVGVGIINLFNNQSLINNGTSPLSNLTNLLIGYYPINSTYSGNENYTSDTEVWYVNCTSAEIPEAPPIVFLGRVYLLPNSLNIPYLQINGTLDFTI